MNTWSLSWRGLRVVTGLEVRQRIRSRRWLVALAAWFVFVGAITTLVIGSAMEGFTRRADTDSSGISSPGPLAFGLNVLFVLGMGLVIAPTFTATSINGDRTAGTLATLQATRLSALEIAAGKLLAAWLTSAVFLVVSLPFIVWTMVLGSISIWQVLVCLAVVFVLVAVVCAIGLGWSSLLSRSAGSAVMTYLCIVALGIISPMVMALSVPFLTSQDTVKVWGLPQSVADSYYAQLDEYWKANPDGDGSGAPAPPLGECTWTEQVEQQTHFERTWWLLVPNPFVVVADAAPLPALGRESLSTYIAHTGDPLAGIRVLVRQAATPPATERDDCIYLYSNLGYNIEWEVGGTPRVTTPDGTPVTVQSPVQRQSIEVGPPVWPWGLGVNLLIGAAFFSVAVRRLAIPYGSLPRGVRVA